MIGYALQNHGKIIKKIDFLFIYFFICKRGMLPNGYNMRTIRKLNGKLTVMKKFETVVIFI